MSKKIAIIGAGIAGLTLAKRLKTNLDWQIDIFDKGRSVGGRMSSRRTDWGYLDHGCQYFSVKDPLFQEFLREYEDLIIPWQSNFARWQDGEFVPVTIDKTRYVAQERMNNLCKAIVTNFNVRINTRIVELIRQQTWSLQDKEGNLYEGYDWIIVTAPPAQTYDLLNSHTDISEDIKAIEMLPCYSLMLVLPTKLELNFAGIELEHPVLGWIAANHLKPLRGEQNSLVIQSNFTWAKQHLADDRNVVTSILKTACAEILNITLDDCLYESLHLWRYALPAQVNQAQYYLDAEKAIAVCGDWCYQGKVESAFLSAYSLAEALLKSNQ